MGEPKAQPKGSMCLACSKREQDCSNLKFEKMIVLGRCPDTDAKIVKCTEFERSMEVDKLYEPTN